MYIYIYIYRCQPVANQVSVFIQPFMFAMCVLNDTVLSSVTKRYTGFLQLIFSCLLAIGDVVDSRCCNFPF